MKSWRDIENVHSSKINLLYTCDCFFFFTFTFCGVQVNTNQTTNIKRNLNNHEALPILHLMNTLLYMMASDRYHLTNNRFLHNYKRCIGGVTTNKARCDPLHWVKCRSYAESSKKKKAPLSTQEEMSLQIDLCFTNLASGL